MKLREQLFWVRFRPNSINPEKGKIPMILLPRIKNIIDKELQTNFIFSGGGGIGKTSAAQILLESFDTLRINCSMPDQRGIDVVGETILDHCKNFSIPLKKKSNKKYGDPYSQKAVFLEEFDNTTPDMRKALRGFIEEHPDVRFIACVNNITKLQRTEEDLALLSRFNIINFDAETKEEIEFVKNQQLKYLKAISKSIKFEVSDESLQSLILRTFPNFRKTVQLLQEIYLSGDLETYLKTKDSLNQNVYDFIMNGENNLNDNFFYVCDNFSKEKTMDLLSTLSRPFFKFLMENHQDIIQKKGQEILNLTKIYNAEYTITIDPEMHLIDFITKLKKIVNI